MSHIEHTNESIQSGRNEYSELSAEFTHTFRFGKNIHDYQKIKHEPINELENEEDNIQETVNIKLTTGAAIAAIMKIKSELKFLCSLQVHNSDESSTTAFDIEDLTPTSSDYTTLEPSFELPIEDTLFLQEFINNPQNSSTLNDSWLSDFPVDSIDQLLTPDPDMTFKDLTDIPMEQNDEYLEHLGMTTNIPSSSLSTETVQDDTTNSSGDSVSDDTERDERNRRGLKKSGGPVRKLARFGNKSVIKYSNEYHDRRVKNNEAVKKSRSKAKDKHKDSEVKMTKLATENRTLTDRVDLLMKELQVLKSLYKELNQDLPPSAMKALQRVNIT